jgi:hypothetical protein
VAIAATPAVGPTFYLAREAAMWRIALISLVIAAGALSACEQDVQIAKLGAGDYEVVTLMAD